MNKKDYLPTVVFDTETCGIANDSVILTLSAVRFNRLANSLKRDEGNEFHVNLSIPEQLLKQRVVESGTMKWWSQQIESAKKAAFLGEPIANNRQALEQFFRFVDDSQLFCRGTDFDPPKLISLCKDFNVKVPIKYNEYRDVRTYIDAFTNGKKGYMESIETPEWIVPHNSLHDCWRDAIQMVEARKAFVANVN